MFINVASHLITLMLIVAVPVTLLVLTVFSSIDVATSSEDVEPMVGEVVAQGVVM